MARVQRAGGFVTDHQYDFRILLDSDYQIAQEYNVVRIPVRLSGHKDGWLKLKVSGPFNNQAAIKKMVCAATIVNSKDKEIEMGDVLNEAYGVVQCKECPWYKSCVMPMRFTAEDLRRQLESGSPGMGAPANDIGLQNLLSGMATAAQNSLLEACPIFVERLRTNAKLAQKLKQIMQNWSSEG